MVKSCLPETFNPDEFLLTKVNIPALNNGIIHRSRLVDILQSGSEHQVTLLVAPTGYGKTTLLSDWLSCTSTPDWRIVWVTLDDFDDTPFRFWSYVVLGFRRAIRHLRFGQQQLIQYGLQPDNLTLLNPFLNEIEQIPHPIYLILDDYQVISDSAIHRSLEYLINHQPSNLHLVLASRVTPPVVLSRLQAQGRMIEITAPNLSFTYTESRAFLSDMMGLKIDPDQMALLHNATEGWAAGLHLAALVLKSRNNLLTHREDFPFGQRKIINYLIEEVLAHQSDDIRDFLLKTSVLPELCPALCDAVLGRSDSQAMLYRIEQANLFIVPLVEQGEWYRYHTLFSDALQETLNQEAPNYVQQAHRNAYQWLRSNGYADKAISHALAAGDIEIAAEIVDSCALKAIIEYNLSRLTYWISRFSADLLVQRPQLYIYDALATSFMGNVSLAEAKLQSLEQVLQENKQDVISGELETSIRWKMFAIRTVMKALEGDTAEAIPVIQTLLEDGIGQNFYFIGYLNNTLAVLYDLAEDYQSAAYVYERGCNYSKSQDLMNEYVKSSGDLALANKRLGRLSDAERKYHQALQFSTQHSAHAGPETVAKTGLMCIALEKNDIEMAERWALDVESRLECMEESTSISYFQLQLASRLAHFHFISGDVDRSNDYWNKIGGIFNGSPNANLTSEIIDFQVYRWIITGDLSAGEQWLSKRIDYLRPKHKAFLTLRLGLARIYLAQNKPIQAMQLLNDLEEVACKNGIREREMEVLLLKSKVLWMQQKKKQAFKLISKALSLAITEGYLRIFIHEGDIMKDLLTQYAAFMDQNPPDKRENIEYDYVMKILSAFGAKIIRRAQPVPETIVNNDLFLPKAEPLSVRETEVLKLLCTGVPVKEVAASLTISINTAKAHVRSIYEKLGVHERSELIKRSRDLGFLG